MVGSHSSEFDADPIRFILQGNHSYYYVIAPGEPRNTVGVDVQSGEIWDSAAR